MTRATTEHSDTEAWDRLRSDQRLGRRRAGAAMECVATALLNELQDGR